MKKYMSSLKINSFNFTFFAFKHFKNIKYKTLFFLRDINIICFHKNRGDTDGSTSISRTCI